MEEALVLYPSPGMGHLVPMVELGKLILKHHPFFSVKILILNPPYSTGSTSDYISAISVPSLTFHYLPTLSLPPSSSHEMVEDLAYQLPRLNNPNLRKALDDISETAIVRALIFDFFNDAALEVAGDLNIPAYYFFTCGAGGLAGFLYFPTLHKMTTGNFKDDDILFNIPGLPPIVSSDMPTPLQVRNTNVYNCMLNTAGLFTKSSGILVNTFSELELLAMEALTSGICVKEGRTPPIFAVGPVIASIRGGRGEEEHECLRWLSSQPSKSVVFLCFGSMGLHGSKQIREMAAAIEKSGQRFLWVVRSPPEEGEDESQTVGVPSDPDLEKLLPEGFLDRTQGRGMVVKSWAPQVAVLNHDSVGGFVSHCGWNSLLEAICAGVPVLAWPLYAEQRMNRVILVKQMKIGLSVNESRDGVVSSAELEERLRELMETEIGKEVRERIERMRDEAAAALEEGGSSVLALAELAKLWMQDSQV